MNNFLILLIPIAFITISINVILLYRQRRKWMILFLPSVTFLVLASGVAYYASQRKYLLLLIGASITSSILLILFNHSAYIAQNKSLLRCFLISGFSLLISLVLGFILFLRFIVGFP